MVGTHGRDEGKVFTGTDDGSIFRVSPRRPPDRPGRAARAAARSASSSTRTVGSWSATRTAACCGSTRRPAGRAPSPTHRRRPDALLQQRGDRLDGTIWFSDSSPAARHRAVEGRLRPGHAHGAAAWPAATPTGRSRSSSTGCRSPTASPCPPTSPSSRSPRAGRGRSSAIGSRASVPGSGTCSSTTCPATPTTSPGGSDGLIWVTIASPVDAVVGAAGTRTAQRAPAGHPDPRAASAAAEADRPGAGVRRRRAASCTTAEVRTATATTWSPASGSTRAGSGWAASRSPPSRFSTCDHPPLDSLAWATSSRSRPRVTCATSRDAQLDELASEIRDFLVARCSRTGGHLGPNLGVVELTMALHRVFDSPRDRIVFDTGHQAYVHKILTGRARGLRQAPPGGRPSAATRARPSPSTTSSRTPTRPPRCPTPTGWPRRTPSAARTATSSPSSATARSPAAWPGRR